MKNLMIDLETLSTDTSAAILSIGACIFDPATRVIEPCEFYEELGLSAALSQAGRSADSDTLLWWMNRGPEAKKVLSAEPRHLSPVLDMLSKYVLRSSPEAVWSNGSNFDIAILEHAFSQAGIRVPWHFRDIRDVRTIVSLGRAIGADKNDIEFVGTPHHALHDARYQADYVSYIYQALTIPS